MSPIIIAFLSLSLSVLPPSSADKFTAYDALQTFNFPVGLLPKGALGYDLDEKTGKFTAYLNETCSFSLEGSYDLKYQSKITGYISRNNLRNLNGISVKVLFLWLNIVEVTRVDDEIDFSVGIASASFPINNFDQCPQCGCGLDCDTVHVRKMKSNAFVSSL
ncbi:hypothetical protein Nepgr_004443 [Nepenthes gracilis]|uniref:Uncharacterized protein n=1 Tax=Nepenthes gracilis TaxID=150966 RepID=A0AAD3S1Q9_NEPGR|nr:hypothetical protein Nepgr_004443 [Nepenthes gracilis]